MVTNSALVGGLRLSYVKEGSGPALVFLHGSALSALQWEPLLPYFLARYTCFALDSRGSGGSEGSDTNDYWMETLTSEGIGFLEDVSGSAIIVGHAWGAGLAMAAAARRPDLVRAVYCEDLAPQSLLKPRLAEGAAFIIAMFRWIKNCAESRDAQGQSLAQFAYNIGAMEAGPTNLAERMGPLNLYRMASSMYRTRPGMFDDPLLQDSWSEAEVAEVIAGLKCPVHIAYGDVDMGSTVLLEDLEGLRAAGVNITSTHFPGTGHAIFGNAPREYLADLRAFLSRL